MQRCTCIRRIGEVRAGRWARGRRRCPAKPPQAVERVPRAARAQHQVHRQHAVRLVESEKGARRDAMHVRHGQQIAQHRGRAREQTDEQAKEDAQRQDVHRPQQPGAVDPEEDAPHRPGRRRLGDVGRRRRRQDFVAQEFDGRVAVGADESGEIERPDEVRVEQHPAGEQADERQRRGVGRREPEPVPRLPQLARSSRARRRRSTLIGRLREWRRRRGLRSQLRAAARWRRRSSSPSTS